VRSYRGVLDSVERRIFRIDRWRIPKPDGLSVRSITYALAGLLVVLICGRLPVAAPLLGILPASVRLVAVPVLIGWGLSAWTPDGRAPHHALISVLRHLRAPKHLAGLRPCPPVGADLLGVAEIQIAPSGDEPGYRPGRVRGPVRVLLRYPAVIGAEGGPRHPSGAAERFGAASRLTVEGRGRRVKPLPRGHEIRVPAGKEIRFR